LGIRYNLVAIKQSQLKDVLAPTEYAPDGYADEAFDSNEGEVFFDKGFGVIYDILWRRKTGAWDEARIAFFGSPERPRADERGYIDAADVRRAAEGLRALPRAPLRQEVRAMAEVVHGKASEEERREANELERECLDGFEELTTFYEKAANANLVVLIFVG